MGASNNGRTSPPPPLLPVTYSNSVNENSNDINTTQRRRRPRLRLTFPCWTRVRSCCPWCRLPEISLRRIRILTVLTLVTDSFMYLLGPVLIVIAVSILSGLCYTYFAILLPMLEEHDETHEAYMYTGLVVFIVLQISFHYYKCVTTSNRGAAYDRVVRELADATGFIYPETAREIQRWKREFDAKIMTKFRRLRTLHESSNFHHHDDPQHESAIPTPGTVEQQTVTDPDLESNNTTTTGLRTRSTALTSSLPTTTTTNPQSTTNHAQRRGAVRAWMLIGPHDWSYCDHSQQPKPPRSHYDHVTRTLVLNMDHYCPWMFNTVGYFNYRYFVNFLLYTFFGMLYGAILTFRPFMAMDSAAYRHQVKDAHGKGLYRDNIPHILPFVPTPIERTPIAMSFMLCLSVGLAVLCLLVFHLYLVLTAQTTVEFHGNCAKYQTAKRRGDTTTPNNNNNNRRNPYDLGYKRNFQQIWGTGNPIWAMLIPSSREPEFLPLPIPGDRGLRCKWKRGTTSPLSIDRNNHHEEEETTSLMASNESNHHWRTNTNDQGGSVTDDASLEGNSGTAASIV